MTISHRFERIFALATILACAGAFAATAFVASGRAPLVFNESQRAGFAINVMLLLMLAALAALLIGSFFQRHLAGLRRPALCVVSALVALDMMLFVFDKTVISVKGSVVHSAAYTVNVGNESFYIYQPTQESPFGFRSARLEPKIPEGKRILMLGNSYVQGSGSTFAANYPQAMETDLKRVLPDEPLSVFSAGVNGYGVVEDRLVYGYLTQQGYRFDTVVLNFMLGSDPTNDIPGTVRASIVGQPQRLHSNLLLRYFYPVNSSLFRFIIYLEITFGQKWRNQAPSMVQNASCTQSPDFAAYTSERARYYYGPGAQQRIDMRFDLQQIDALASATQRDGARFVIVLLPDPAALLAPNRARFRDVDMRWDWTRRYIADRVAGRYDMLDLSSHFQDRPDLFRCNDVHWNDAGNREGATIVADYLAGTLFDNRHSIDGSHGASRSIDHALSAAMPKEPEYADWR